MVPKNKCFLPKKILQSFSFPVVLKIMVSQSRIHEYEQVQINLFTALNFLESRDADQKIEENESKRVKTGNLR